jgi:hypothetical protein
VSEESPTPRQFPVERLRKASVWSENTLLECTEDEESVLFTITQDAHSLSIRLTKEQWRELREAWNGLGHMTVDTCGKPDLPTLPTALKAQRLSAEGPRSSQESWCPTMAIRWA